MLWDDVAAYTVVAVAARAVISSAISPTDLHVRPPSSLCTTAPLAAAKSRGPLAMSFASARLLTRTPRAKRPVAVAA